MSFSFSSIEKRRDLFNQLISSGFKVRMHSYEYFIRGKKFVCVVVLYPEWSSATIYRVKWDLEEVETAVEKIVKILATLDPKLKIEVT